MTAQQTIDNTGGVIQGLGAASSASLNARDIILRTTTQTSVASIEGPNGISTGTRTNVDRIATVTADSVQLAALNNISLQGATVSAKEDLVMTAGGAITSDSVQTGYTLNIPLGGGGSQGRSSFYNAAATTQQAHDADAAKPSRSPRSAMPTSRARTSLQARIWPFKLGTSSSRRPRTACPSTSRA